MFSKLQNKLKDKASTLPFDIPGLPPGQHQQQQQLFQQNDFAGGAGGMHAPLESQSKQAIFRYRLWRGCNLGSWFVLEKWIASRPYARTSGGADLDVARGSGSMSDKQRDLEHHWDTWVGEEDLKWLCEKGVNTVRLPIGYYHLAGLDKSLLDGTDFDFAFEIFQGAWSRIIRAIQLADKYGIGVLLDLHSCPGGQNNDNHSGANGKPKLFESSKNQKNTVRILQALVSAVHQMPNVVGVEILNEPAFHNNLHNFQLSTLATLRNICGPDFPLIVSDSWQLSHCLKTYFPTTTFTVIDNHVYRAFTTEDAAKPCLQHAHEIKHDLRAQFQGEICQPAGACGRVIIGEWSGALNPGSFHGVPGGGPQDEKRRQFVRSQLEVFDTTTSGYFFWTLKKEEGWDAGWSFRNAHQAEILPSRLGPQSKPGRHVDSNLGHQAKDAAMASHVGWWTQHERDPMEHDRFERGFLVGFYDALNFLTSGWNHPSGSVSEIPPAGGQWQVRRRMEHIAQRGDSRWTWEFDHGFDQGVKAAKEAWSRA